MAHRPKPPRPARPKKSEPRLRIRLIISALSSDVPSIVSYKRCIKAVLRSYDWEVEAGELWPRERWEVWAGGEGI